MCINIHIYTYVYICMYLLKGLKKLMEQRIMMLRDLAGLEIALA